jgi:hypothetical protein
MAAPAHEGVSTGDGRGASSELLVCITCGLPVPLAAPAPTLDELIVAALREAPDGLVVGSLARLVHRRRADVEAELDRLAAADVVIRGEPRGHGRGSRGRPWTLKAPGRISDASWTPRERGDGYAASGALLGALGLLAGSGAWPRRVVVALTLAAVFLLLGSLAAAREEVRT